MAKNENIQRADVDLSESTARSNPQTTPDNDEGVTEIQIDRLEAISGGDDEDPLPISENLQWQFDSLDASTEEELDALEVNLTQDGDSLFGRDGSGRVDDGIAEEEMAKLTEVGPAVNQRGAESVDPGTQDTSEVLRRHRPFPKAGDESDAIVEGNIDQPLDEGLQ